MTNLDVNTFTKHQCEHGLVLAILSDDPQNLVGKYHDDAMSQMNDKEYVDMIERVSSRVFSQHLQQSTT